MFVYVTPTQLQTIVVARRDPLHHVGIRQLQWLPLGAYGFETLIKNNSATID